MNKPKLLFVYDMPEWKEKYWMDGLWAALNLLEEDFEITRCNVRKEDVGVTKPTDFVLGWGGFSSPVDKYLKELSKIDNARYGLCIGGNAFPPSGTQHYDVLFYETKWYRPQINFHKNIVHAFGINSDIYNQEKFSISHLEFATPVIWDYIGVGSLAAWKRWEKMTDKQGSKLVVGEYQHENPAESGSIANHLLSHNVMVSQMVNPYDLANFYYWSRVCYIPADINGGGERAVLEARACGLQVEIEDDNPKLKELLDCPIYDHHYYAQQLKKGILSCL